MSIDYYIVDTVRKRRFELGSGEWMLGSEMAKDFHYQAHPFHPVPKFYDVFTDQAARLRMFGWVCVVWGACKRKQVAVSEDIQFCLELACKIWVFCEAAEWQVVMYGDCWFEEECKNYMDYPIFMSRYDGCGDPNWQQSPEISRSKQMERIK